MTIKHHLTLKGMSCASCVRKIETALAHVPGVVSASVNFAESTALVEADEKVSHEALIDAVKNAGYEASMMDMSMGHVHNHMHHQDEASLSWLYALVPGVIGLLFMLQGMFSGMLPFLQTHFQILGGVESVITLGIFFFAARSIYSNTFKSLRHFSTTMDTLIALGISAAWEYSTAVVLFFNVFFVAAQHLYFESALIILAFINLGNILEARARGKASNEIMAWRIPGLLVANKRRWQDTALFGGCARGGY